MLSLVPSLWLSLWNLNTLAGGVLKCLTQGVWRKECECVGECEYVSVNVCIHVHMCLLVMGGAGKWEDVFYILVLAQLDH